jgi:hypothetical protein
MHLALLQVLDHTHRAHLLPQTTANLQQLTALGPRSFVHLQVLAQLQRSFQETTLRNTLYNAGAVALNLLIQQL